MKKHTVTFAGSAASPRQFPRDGLPEVAFLGRSNVGKSRLLNALVGARGLARVSGRPGRTQLVNFFRMDDALYLVDLPGYGYAKVAESVRRGFEELATSYLVGRDPLALCVFLVDARHDPTEGDETLRRLLDRLRLPYVVAATKADKLGKGALERRRRELEEGLFRGARVIPTSAEDGTGVPELLRAIRRAAEAHAQGPRSVAVSREA